MPPRNKRSTSTKLNGLPHQPISVRESFKSKLESICTSLGLTLTELADYHPNQLRVEFSPHFPMWIRIDVEESTEEAVLVGVVRTFGFPGDRSDYHELISLLWAAFLRAAGFASVRILDIPHPVCEGELYGRYLVFEKQPGATFVSLREPNFALLSELLIACRKAAQLFSLVYEASDGDPEREISGGPEGKEWAHTVARSLKVSAGIRGELSNQRQNPNWCYYYRDIGGITSFKLPVKLFAILVGCLSKVEGVVADVNDCYLVQTGSLKNTINKAAMNRVCRALGAYGLRVNGSLVKLVHGDVALFLPTDSHLICAVDGGLVAIRSDGDDRSYRDAEARLRTRHQREAQLLHASIRFSWTRHVNDDRFEELVLDLMNREPGVRRVRKVGASRASDGERDLIAEWLQPPASWESATEKQALVSRRVVVQCKAYSGSINRTKVGDVPGTVDLHDANGYLLVAFPRITPPLFDYLSKVPAKRKIWADWWTQSEIEDRLRRNIDIARRYPDLFSISEP